MHPLLFKCWRILLQTLPARSKLFDALSTVPYVDGACWCVTKSESSTFSIRKEFISVLLADHQDVVGFPMCSKQIHLIPRRENYQSLQFEWTRPDFIQLDPSGFEEQGKLVWTMSENLCLHCFILTSSKVEQSLYQPQNISTAEFVIRPAKRWHPAPMAISWILSLTPE